MAVVGSGPSGLACAAQLGGRGHAVTVFERADRPGGLLMYGIPNMKLEKRIVERRVALMAAEGIVFRTGVDVGRTSAQDLLKDYDAVVLCCGAAEARDLKVPGREGGDVYFAVDFSKPPPRACWIPISRTGSTSQPRGKMWSSSAAATRATTVWAPPSVMDASPWYSWR